MLRASYGGGRNITGEYFALNTAQKFIDTDTFMVGKVLSPLRDIFDDYLNSDQIYPVAAIVSLATPRAAFTDEFDTWVSMAAFRDIRERGVAVTLLSNSLAANDEPLLYTGDARYRRLMLEVDIDLYELSPARTTRSKRLGLFGGSLGRLHAKTAVIDRHKMLIGSVKLNPRSANKNTEPGIMVGSLQLALEMLRISNTSKLGSAYRLRPVGNTSAIKWLTMNDEKEVNWSAESRSSWFMLVDIHMPS